MKTSLVILLATFSMGLFQNTHARPELKGALAKAEFKKCESTMNTLMKKFEQGNSLINISKMDKYYLPVSTWSESGADYSITGISCDDKSFSKTSAGITKEQVLTQDNTKLQKIELNGESWYFASQGMYDIGRDFYPSPASVKCVALSFDRFFGAHPDAIVCLSTRDIHSYQTLECYASSEEAMALCKE